jgi:Putative cyclase
VTTTADGRVSVAEFEEIFESVKNWRRWGPDDELGTLNYITPEKVRAAAGLVRSGRRVSMAIPINKVAGPDNPSQASLLLVQGHDVPVDESKVGFGLDWLGMPAHGDCHTHVDALCHISYGGLTYNGRPAGEVLPSTGATAQDIAAYHEGIVGRGVLLDIPKLRGVKWLEPGEAVTASELEECAAAQAVEIGEGDILVFRTGHHRRRLLSSGGVPSRAARSRRGRGLALRSSRRRGRRRQPARRAQSRVWCADCARCACG